MQNILIINMNIFCNRLFQKYKIIVSQTFDKLINEHYFIIDVQKFRFANDYLQIILRYSKIVQLFEYVTFIIV